MALDAAGLPDTESGTDLPARLASVCDSCCSTNLRQGASVGAAGKQRAPSLGCGSELTVLLLGESEQDARLDQIWIKHQGSLQDLAGVLGHHAIIGKYQRTTVTGKTLRRFPEEPDRLPIRLGGVGVAAPAHIDRGDDLPSLPFFGMLP